MLTQGIRSLARSRSGLLIALACLSASIAVNTAITAICGSLLFPQLGIYRPETVVRVGLLTQSHEERWPVPPQVFFQWKQYGASFSALAAETPDETAFDVRFGSVERTVSGRLVTSDFFSTLGVKPSLGRGWTPEDDTPQAPETAVVSYRLWSSLLGSAGNLSAVSIKVNGQLCEVAGVLPREFRLRTTDLWIARPLLSSKAMNVGLGITPYLNVWGRLKGSVSAIQAAASLQSVGTGQTGPSAGARPIVRTVIQEQRENGRFLSLPLGLASCGVLLIACATVGGVLLMRTSRRRREIGIRRALGAGGAQLVVQFMLEGLLLALASWVAGAAAAPLLSHLLLASAPLEIQMRAAGASALSFTVISLLLACMTGAAASAPAAWLAMRQEPNSAIRAESAGSTFAPGARAVRNLLLGVQIAGTVCLIILSGLILKSMTSILGRFIQIDPSDAIAFKTTLTGPRYGGNAGLFDFSNALINRLSAVPGVRYAGSTTFFPVSDGAYLVVVEKVQGGTESRTCDADLFSVNGDYLAALGLRLLAGRAFRVADGASSPQVAVIDTMLARRLWPESPPLHARLRVEGVVREVVGIVPFVQYRNLDDLQPRPQIFIPLSQSRMPFPFAVFVVRTDHNSGVTSAAIRRAISGVDSSILPRDLAPVRDLIAATLRPQQFAVRLLSGLALAAALFSLCGVYAAVSYAVSQGRREIGIRMAIGAGPRRIVWEVSRRTLLLVGAGTAAGCVAAALSAPAIAALVYGVGLVDVAVYSVVIACTLVAGGAAAFFPAWSATSVTAADLLKDY